MLASHRALFFGIFDFGHGLTSDGNFLLDIGSMLRED
jgi:hypothetical protein